MTTIIKDMIIIGAGTTGMTSALYALRSGKSVLLLEKESVGGQIALSPKVENYPAIKTVSGNEFADNLFEQIIDLGVEFEAEEALSVTKTDGIFTVVTDCNIHKGKTVIIATGVRHKHLHVPGEERLTGHGISYCAICDGPFYKGGPTALIGDGNTALQYAVMLASYCPKVYVCTLFDKFFGDEILVETLKRKTNAEIIPNICLTEFIGDKKLEALRFRNTITNDEFILEVPAVFIAIGQIPDNKAFSEIVKLDAEGYIITDEDLETGTPGLFAAGDCRVKKLRQLTTAVGDGATAAINASAYIDRNFGEN